MPRVLGIDPGTRSFDLCGLADGEVFLEQSLPSQLVAERPDALVELLLSAGPVDLIAGPSGYGLPCTPIEAVGERELRLMLLPDPSGTSPLLGMGALVRRLREARLPVVFLPGVIHLPTIPARRKVNRIDIGTADKVCAAAFAIDDEARRMRLPWGETAFVLVELGRAFTAVLSVAAGRIVSGQGGSSGPMGYLAAGALDGEAACLLRRVPKQALFSGGAAFVAGAPHASPDELLARDDDDAIMARAALVEAVVRAVAAEIAVAPGPREILLSGPLAHLDGFRDALAAALSRFASVHRPRTGAVKEAARGAALIADGLAGGAYAGLVDSMRVREARGTLVDHLYMAGAAEAKEWLASGF
jgi:predicted butyrate kinase (DUF1464 family)